ncbi:MAG TPA: YceI family protein [Pyrinomonadaceae bacterium]|nr:YceI family protein [Pyrinomonadaceae bacterium]
MRLGVLTMVLAGSTLLAGCGNPATNKSQAVTGEAQTAASPRAAAAQTYVITPENSKIEFVGSKVTGSHNGSFQKFSGEIHYTGDVNTSHVTITMQTDSLTTDTPDLTKHLKTADFFDVAKYPEAKFESTAIKAGGDKGASHTITGNLTLHGATKSVTFPATIAVAPDAITVDSSFTINRKDFGINYAGAADNLIRDNVVMTLKIKATKS